MTVGCWNANAASWTMVRAAEHVALEQAQNIGEAGKTVVRSEQAHLLTHIVRKPKHTVFSVVEC